MVHVWQCFTCTALVVARCSYPLNAVSSVECGFFEVQILQCSVVFFPNAIVLPKHLGVHFYICRFFNLLCCYVCLLDAQLLTATLVALEDLDLRLQHTTMEAVEELWFIPTLRQLKLKVVSDHLILSPL